MTTKNNFHQDITNSKKLLDEIAIVSKSTNNKLESLAAKLPKKIVDKIIYDNIFKKINSS